MNKRTLIATLALACVAPLASCDFIESIFGNLSSSSPSSDSTPVSSSTPASSSSSSSSSSTPVQDSNTRTFRHAFIKDDFSSGLSGSKLSAGETTVNGLTFSFSGVDYFSQHNSGVQVGSESKPQTAGWVLTTALPEGTVVTGWSATVENARGGSAHLEATFGDHTFQQAFTAADGLQSIFENSLEVPAETFSLSLKAEQKAMYFYELSISLYNPDGLPGEITDDSGATRDPVTPGENDIPEVAYELTTPEIYYADVDLTQQGEALLLALRDRISDNKVLDYGDAKQMLLYTDESLDRPGYDLGMWDGDYIPATWTGGGSWQREHVWAASHLGLPAGEDGHDDKEQGAQSDLHNLRVACASTNNYHSNRFFGNEDVPETSGQEGYFYPNVDTGDNLSGLHEYAGDWRGDAARICFYMATRYDNLNLNDDPLASPDDSMGLLSVMLEWNEEDPVDDFERQRNDRVYQYQGNRNPFIDYPDLADAIWNS